MVGPLSGPATKIVESIEISDRNYAIAWELLKKQYEDERDLFANGIFSAYSNCHESIENPLMQFKNHQDHVHEHLRVLQSMKLPTESWGELITDREKFGRQYEATLGRTYRANGSRNDKYYDKVFAATVSSVRADVFKRK